MQDNWRTLRAELFPTKVMLEISDLVLVAQPLPQGREALAEPWIVPIPAATLRQGRPVEAEALGDFIGDLLLNQGAITAHLSVALPAAAAQWRLLEWPLREWPLEPAQRLRQLQPNLNLPFPLERAYLDLMPLQGAEGQALLVAMERELMEAWLEMFAIAGVQLERLVPAQVAVMAALQERLADADPAALVALLMPEPKALRLLVWRGGLPIYERVLAGAPEQAALQLEACLRFLRAQQGLGPAAAAILLLADGLLPDARATLEEAIAQRLGQPPAAMELDGWGSLAVQGLARLEEAQ